MNECCVRLHTTLLKTERAPLERKEQRLKKRSRGKRITGQEEIDKEKKGVDERRRIMQLLKDAQNSRVHAKLHYVTKLQEGPGKLGSVRKHLRIHVA
jgi:hypothetical protein